MGSVAPGWVAGPRYPVSWVLAPCILNTHHHTGTALQRWCVSVCLVQLIFDTTQHNISFILYIYIKYSLYCTTDDWQCEHQMWPLLWNYGASVSSINWSDYLCNISFIWRAVNYTQQSCDQQLDQCSTWSPGSAPWSPEKVAGKRGSVETRDNTCAAFSAP